MQRSTLASRLGLAYICTGRIPTYRPPIPSQARVGRARGREPGIDYLSLGNLRTLRPCKVVSNSLCDSESPFTACFPDHVVRQTLAFKEQTVKRLDPGLV